MAECGVLERGWGGLWPPSGLEWPCPRWSLGLSPHFPPPQAQRNGVPETIAFSLRGQTQLSART